MTYSFSHWLSWRRPSNFFFFSSRGIYENRDWLVAFASPGSFSLGWCYLCTWQRESGRSRHNGLPSWPACSGRATEQQGDRQRSRPWRLCLTASSLPWRPSETLPRPGWRLQQSSLGSHVVLYRSSSAWTILRDSCHLSLSHTHP